MNTEQQSKQAYMKIFIFRMQKKLINKWPDDLHMRVENLY